MQDPYKVLGVDQNASDASIKKAYRRLAKLYHPDHNANDTSAKEKFNNISTAYDLLRDREKRLQYDRGMIDGAGNPVFKNGFYANGNNNSGGFSGYDQQSFWQNSNSQKTNRSFFEDIFKDLFSDNFRQNTAHDPAGQQQSKKGNDIVVSAKVSFETAVMGGKVRLKLPNKKQVDVKIAPGTKSGNQIRLKGFGNPGYRGGVAGDCLINIEVKPHPVFKIDGNNLRMDLPVTLYEAVLGGKIRVPSLTKSIVITVPPGTSSGKVLRVKGYGIKSQTSTKIGDLLLKVMITLPSDGSHSDLEKLMREWRASKPYHAG